MPNQPASYIEYAKNRLKIICTQDYFANNLDHTKLNTKHHIIQIINPNKYPQDIINLLKDTEIPVTIQLSFADNTIGPVISTPIHHLTFGKNSTIFLYPESKYLIPVFKSSKYWQIEIISPFFDTFILTAPKHPKISILN